MTKQRFERIEAQMVEQVMARVKHAKIMAEWAKVMVEQAKVKVDQVKVSVEERKKQTQSQMKLLEATSGVMGETRQTNKKLLLDL